MSIEGHGTLAVLGTSLRGNVANVGGGVAGGQGAEVFIGIPGRPGGRVKVFTRALLSRVVASPSDYCGSYVF